MAERVQVPIRMDPALVRRIDDAAENARKQLGVAGAKWSRNDQIVWMLTTALEDARVDAKVRGGKKRG